MLISDQMPDLSRYRRPEDQINALYQYIYSLKQQINHVLSNLDETNLTKELQSTLSSMQKSVTEAVQQTGQKATSKQEMWPVGAVYVTSDAAQDPAKLFGGTWEQMNAALIESTYAWVRKE